MFTTASNIHFSGKRWYDLVASRQKEFPFCRGGLQRGEFFNALVEIIGRTTFQCGDSIAKHVGGELLEFAASEIAEVFSARKNFKKMAKSVDVQTLEN